VDLTLATRPEGDRTVVEVGGEIDVYTAPQLRSALNDAVADGARHLVVDMTGTEFLDSTGLGVLVAGLKRVRSAGGRMELAVDDPRVLKVLRIAGLKRVRTMDGDLELVCASEKILKVFRITGLTKVFTIHPSIEEALGAAGTTA
jgi:anti-sigma B factor antagonist